MSESFSVLYNKLEGDCPQDFIESMQCAIVRAGGVFMSREYLENCIDKKLLEILHKNSLAVIYLENKV